MLCDVVQGETLFRTVIEVTGGGGAAGASGGSSEAAVRTALEDYMARLPQPLEMVEVRPLSRVWQFKQKPARLRKAFVMMYFHIMGLVARTA